MFYTYRVFIILIVMLLQSCIMFNKRNTYHQLAKGSFPARSKQQYEATSKKFMVATQGKETSKAAQEILLAGGNAFDAFAAASFAISVERPQSTGIGGGGFLVGYNHRLKKAIAVDFREKAPLKASHDMYLDKNKNIIKNLSRQGGLSSGVPGVVKGVLEIHAKYGKLSRQQIMKPAIRLARQGFPVYAHLEAAIKEKKRLLWKNKDIRSTFFKGKGTPLVIGDILKQPLLTKTLELISKHGSKAFYYGKIANQIVATQKSANGLIRLADLKAYDVKYRKPITTNFLDYQMYSMPPPSSGGVHVAQILKLTESLKLDSNTPYDFKNIHLTTSAMKVAYRDRTRYMGDSDFVMGGVPTNALLDPRYIHKMQNVIEKSDKSNIKLQSIDKKNKFKRLKKESLETSHFTIADSEGNIISSTQTVNHWFGSGVFVKGAGFVMNNEMDDFSAKPGVPNMFGLIGGDENSISPQKRPLSSMSPSIFIKNHRPVLALGTPAGSRIINCVTHVALNYLYYKKPLWEAVAGLRYHHQWQPDVLTVENPGFHPSTINQLKSAGYKIKNKGLGCKVQAIAFENQNIIGVSDPRGEGLAAGHQKIFINNSQKSDDPNKIDKD